MKYEDKVNLLEIFNTPFPDHGGKGVNWSQGHGLKFVQMYRALAASMTGPIQEALDNSELRKSIKVVKLKTGELPKVPPGTPYSKGVGYWDEYLTAGLNGEVRTMSFQAAAEARLGKVTPEAVEKMMRRVVKAIISYEVEAVNKLKDMVDTDDITMFVLQDYVAYDDPTLIKRQQIGVYGWEQVAIAAL